MLLRHLRKIRNLERLLALRARYWARKKKPQKVLESLRAGIALSESLQKEFLSDQPARADCLPRHRNRCFPAMQKDIVFAVKENEAE